MLNLVQHLGVIFVPEEQTLNQVQGDKVQLLAVHFGERIHN